MIYSEQVIWRILLKYSDLCLVYLQKLIQYIYYSDMSRVLRYLIIAAVLPVLVACSEAPEAGFLEKLNASYEAALDQSADSAHVFQPGSAEEQVVLARLQGYFTQMSPESVRQKSAAVYSDEAYLNDNIVGIFGLAKVTDYFVHAAGQAEVLDVAFLDVARSETDYFIRWRMTVQVAALNEGAPIVSYGATQFRFNQQGQVVLHRDFWDAATGLHEQLPYIGGIMNFVHAKLEADGLKN